MSTDEEYVDPHGECAAEIARLRAALSELSAIYSHTWDRVDGALVMMDSGVKRFERAHAKAQKALGVTVIADDGEDE